MELSFRPAPPQRRIAREQISALDVQILQVLWAHGAQNVRQIHHQISAHRRVDYATVVAVVSRLVRGGLLVPEAPARGLSYEYRPSLDREEFMLLFGPEPALLREHALGE